MKPSIFVTRLLPHLAMERIAAYFATSVNPDDRVLTRDEIVEGARGRDALLCLLTDTIDGEMMDAWKGLRVISNYAVGFNNIDVPAATARGIPVCNTPGVLTETTADMAWALLMAAARRIPEGERFTREGKFRGWGPMLLLGSDVHAKTLGIVGMGRIGQAVARRAQGFSMKLLYCDERAPDETCGARRVELDELLRESDFVTLHCPSLPSTYHLIGAEQLAMMKRDAFLINTARGPIVDEAALVEALSSGRISGAALDVYEREPAIHPGLFALENVVLAPHTASATVETRTRMGIMAAENAIDIFEGRRPAAIVNPEALA